MKKYIAERNAREGVAGSGSGDADAPSTPATEVPTEEGLGALDENAAQDGVEK